jgi:hypothetical protein
VGDPALTHSHGSQFVGGTYSRERVNESPGAMRRNLDEIQIERLFYRKDHAKQKVSAPPWVNGSAEIVAHLTEDNLAVVGERAQIFP